MILNDYRIAILLYRAVKSTTFL